MLIRFVTSKAVRRFSLLIRSLRSSFVAVERVLSLVVQLDGLLCILRGLNYSARPLPLHLSFSRGKIELTLIYFYFIEHYNVGPKFRNVN